MSRGSRERHLEAQQRWPTLCQFLGAYLHQDWAEEFDTPEQAIDAAIAGCELAGHQQVLKEWRDWNNTHGHRTDVAAYVNDGLGVEVDFDTELEARQFMNLIHDKLVVSVRAETSRNWKP